MLNIEENIDRHENVILVALLSQRELVSTKGEVINKIKAINELSDITFKNPLCKEFFKCCKRYLLNTEELPTINDVWMQVDLSRNENKVTLEERDFIDSLLLEGLSNAQLFSLVNAFTKLSFINRTLEGLMNSVKLGKVTVSNITEFAQKLVVNFESGMAKNILMEDDSRAISKAKDLLQMPRTCASTGDNYLDRALGGGWARGLYVVGGAPKAGKSTVMGHFATCCADIGGYVGIATLELGSDKYMKRVASSFYKIPLKNFDRYIEGADDESINISEIQRYIDAKKSANPEIGDIIIQNFPLGDSTSMDIRDFFLRQEIKLGIKFSLIIVDYLTLMKSLKKSKDENSYGKVKEISENLRNMGLKHNWPIVTPMQLKPEFWNTDDIKSNNCLEESSGAQKTLDGMFLILPTMIDTDTTPETDFNRIALECKFARDAEPYKEKHYYVKDFNHFRMIPETNVIPQKHKSTNVKSTNINATPFNQYNNNAGLVAPPKSSIGTPIDMPQHDFDIKPNTAFENQNVFESTSVFADSPF